MGIRKTFLAAVLVCLVVLSGCGLSGNSEIRRLEKQVSTLEAQVDNLLTVMANTTCPDHPEMQRVPC